MKLFSNLTKLLSNNNIEKERGDKHDMDMVPLFLIVFSAAVSAAYI